LQEADRSAGEIQRLAVPVWRSRYDAGRLNLRAFRLRVFRNFSRNRPETTNQNHQYAIRRIFIGAILDSGSDPYRLQG
jgi:hypothetical protein